LVCFIMYLQFIHCLFRMPILTLIFHILQILIYDASSAGNINFIFELFNH
jgi:hypothetical protein